MKVSPLRKAGIVSLFCLLAAIVNPAVSKEPRPTAKMDPVAAAIIRELESLPEYRAMKALYEDHRRREGAAWVNSPEGRKMLKTLKDMYAEAASTSLVDPDNPTGRKVLNYTRMDGGVSKLTSVFQRQNETDAEFRKICAEFIGRFITERAVENGLIPYNLSPAINEVMKNGYAAAQRGDYLAAIGHFEKARYMAPKASEIHYNLALAEARVPGRELRAVVWFGAFLAANPKSPKKAAILEKIKELDTQGVTRFLNITQDIIEQIPSQDLKDIYLAGIADLWARVGNFPVAFQTAGTIRYSIWRETALADIAGAQARAGDVADGLETAAGIASVDGRSKALLNISNAQIRMQDIDAALKTVEGIGDPFYRSLALQTIADAQRRAGDPAGALRTLASALTFTRTIDGDMLKSVSQQNVSLQQALAGDLALALQTADSIPLPFNSIMAKLGIAEVLESAGDHAGARRMLAAALAAAEKVTSADDRSSAMAVYAETKARIDAGKPNNYADQNAPSAPAVRLTDWVDLNNFVLNAPVYMDLSTFLKTLPKREPSKITQPLSDTAKKMVEAHETINRMLKQLAIENAVLGGAAK